jgi:hypothetical protein
MLLQTKDLNRVRLHCSDGDIGTLDELYFDDVGWMVRYVVANTGGWLGGRRVLISPHALNPLNEALQVIPVNLSKEQVKDSPGANGHLPISRQVEAAYHKHHGWADYWTGIGVLGASPYFGIESAGAYPPPDRGIPNDEECDDPHLHSNKDLTGHHIVATDGEIGHVTDVVIDDVSWGIRYLVIDTRSWWAGKSVLISPQWIDHISWNDAQVSVSLSRGIIKGAPEIPIDGRMTRDFESSMHAYYAMNGCWRYQHGVPTNKQEKARIREATGY